MNKDDITASDLLHLPHIVIRHDGEILGFIEFATGDPAHLYAMQRGLEGDEVIVCVKVRTIGRFRNDGGIIPRMPT